MPLTLNDIKKNLQLKYSNELAKDDVNLLVDESFNALKSYLQKGSRIEIRNFGSFSTKKYESRLLRDPRNNSVIASPAKYIVNFKMGKAILDGLNN